ncbi:MAG: hypothetical protein P1Q69_20450 [Candidatus Thorarchaeota archaeon]|nr:hypothetical protein [Candidatus Thorarchaeota archaeon]
MPLQEWCSTGGLALASFSTEAEYSTLAHILESLSNEKVTLIHSKPIRFALDASIALIDASSHELTARSALRRRISDQEDSKTIKNPADTQNFLNQLEKMSKKSTEKEWWIWSSPSDLLAHGVDETEIAQCLRVIANDYSEFRFIVLIPRDVHSPRGFAILEYIAEIHFTATGLKDGNYLWSVAKHYDLKYEGAKIEI